MFPIDKPPLKVQRRRWHLSHLHVTAWARSFASLELVSAASKWPEYYGPNTQGSEKHPCSAGTWAGTGHGQSLQAGGDLFQLLFQLNSGWNTLQPIHGSWFFRTEYLLKHAAAHFSHFYSCLAQWDMAKTCSPLQERESMPECSSFRGASEATSG